MNSENPLLTTISGTPQGFANAADFGFSPDASGLENTRALQNAVEGGGTVVVSAPGTYKIGGTVYLGSNTSLLFGNGIFLQKVDEEGPFCHVLLNKGALTKTYDHNITIEGLHILVNGIDVRKFEVYGLHGQIAFFYIKDLRIQRFRCFDVGKSQFAIHICTFEDVIVDDVIIKGKKDGVHFGRGRRFKVRDGLFQTYDDAIALNAHDYSVANPELGWIEDGVIENCRDLADDLPPIGFFCRILAGAWLDWHEGMEVQQSDTVISQGRLYRVQAQPDGTIYRSLTPPTHLSGRQELDGIPWGFVQSDVTHTSGVRNVVFRDISLEKARIGISIHFDNDHYSRSYYPGAEISKQEHIALDNVRVFHDESVHLVEVATPLDVLTITNSSLRNGGIHFRGDAMPDYQKTAINILGCVFKHHGAFELLTNNVVGKEIALKTSASVELHDDFVAIVSPGEGKISVSSDLSGLKDW